MNASIEMLVSQQPGSLERILRVVRHRGFRVTHLIVSHSSDTSCLSMTLSVHGDRNISFLTKQLNKLLDVQSLTESSGLSYAKSA